MDEVVRQCVGCSTISAEQWEVARLPIQVGGLYPPHLPNLAVIVRAVALNHAVPPEPATAGQR